MKCVALIGPSGVERTTHYARLISEEVRHRFCGKRRPNLITLTLCIADAESPKRAKATPEGDSVIDAAAALVRTLGADAVAVCSIAFQTRFADRCPLPLLSIYTPVCSALRQSRARRIGVIGARCGDEEKEWRTALGRAGVTDVLLPVPRDRDHLVKVVDHEFANGVVTESARADVVRIAHSLRQAGARAIVIMTPELTEVLEDTVPVLPIFDIVEHHALAVVDWMTDFSAPPIRPLKV